MGGELGSLLLKFPFFVIVVIVNGLYFVIMKINLDQQKRRLWVAVFSFIFSFYFSFYLARRKLLTELVA